MSKCNHLLPRKSSIRCSQNAPRRRPDGTRRTQDGPRHSKAHATGPKTLTRRFQDGYGPLCILEGSLEVHWKVFGGAVSTPPNPPPKTLWRVFGEVFESSLEGLWKVFGGLVGTSPNCDFVNYSITLFTLLLCYYAAGAVAGSQLCCAVGSAPGPKAPSCVSGFRGTRSLHNSSVVSL